MLRGDHNSVYAYRTVIAVIFHSDLTLGIRTKICHFLSFASYSRQLSEQLMAQVKSERHHRRSLISRIAEHHALVACSLILRLVTFHTTVYIAALLMQGRKHPARLGIKHQLAVIIPDLRNHLTDSLHQVNICGTFHFAGHHNLSGCHKGLTCHFRLMVASKEFIKNSVGNLVGHFIGMSLRDRLTRKQIVHKILD